MCFLVSCRSSKYSRSSMLNIIGAVTRFHPLTSHFLHPARTSPPFREPPRVLSRSVRGGTEIGWMPVPPGNSARPPSALNTFGREISPTLIRLGTHPLHKPSPDPFRGLYQPHTSRLESLMKLVSTIAAAFLLMAGMASAQQSAMASKRRCAPVRARNKT